MGRICDSISILFIGTERFMEKKNKDLPTTLAKKTENYTHHDIDGVVKEDLDLETFKTVCLPNGNKLITARNKKTGEVQGVRLLVKQGNPKTV